MRSSLSAVLAALVVLAALASGPDSTRAQTTEATPVPATVPDQAAPPVPPVMPAADEDPLPDEATVDEVTVRREREDREEWQAGERHPGGGGDNVVMVRNHSDGKMRIRGRIRLAELHGSRAEPINAAMAYSSCTDCQTFAVALEIALIAPGAATIAPENRARALNYECTRCVTVARALQYVFVVDDPSIVPDNIERLMRDMESEIRAIGRERDISANQANARIDAVVVRFQELGSGLQDQLDQSDAPTTPGAPAPSAPSTAPAAPIVPVPSPSPSGV